MKEETPDACSDADETPHLGTFSKDLTRVPGWVIGKKGILKKYYETPLPRTVFSTDIEFFHLPN